jgi:NOL1/NOP2/fmu family ribosome biogenesis protein
VEVAVDHFLELATVTARDRLLIGRVVEVDGEENAGWVMIPVGRLQLVAEAT